MQSPERCNAPCPLMDAPCHFTFPIRTYSD
jgi:hypothetical protein